MHTNKKDKGNWEKGNKLLIREDYNQFKPKYFSNCIKNKLITCFSYKYCFFYGVLKMLTSSKPFKSTYLK